MPDATPGTQESVRCSEAPPRPPPLSLTLQEMPSQGEREGSWCVWGQVEGVLRAGHVEESQGTEDRTEERMQQAQEKMTQMPKEKL